MIIHTIFLSAEKLEILGDICRNYKDYHRGNPDEIRKVMKLEKVLKIQTSGKYKADTTYDVKD